VAYPVGEATAQALRVDFDRRIKLEFHGASGLIRAAGLFHRTGSPGASAGARRSGRSRWTARGVLATTPPLRSAPPARRPPHVTAPARITNRSMPPHRRDRAAALWRLVLEPMIARYRERGGDLYFRADAAFAKPEIYELLEDEGIRHTIRLPANQVLQRRIGDLLTRPVGRPPKKPIVSYAASTTRPTAGPEPVGWWPRSSGTRASSIPASASS
jgi:hypothetical protein